MTSDHANRSSAVGWFPYTSFDETAMLARIGSDLRNLYGNIEDAVPPGDLVHLARLIDEKRHLDRETRERRSGAA